MKIKFILFLLLGGFAFVTAEDLFKNALFTKVGSVVISKDENGDPAFNFSGYSAVVFPYSIIEGVKAGTISFRVKLKFDPQDEIGKSLEYRNQIFFAIVQGRRRFDISLDPKGLYCGLFDYNEDKEIKDNFKIFPFNWNQDEWVTISMTFGEKITITFNDRTGELPIKGLFPENYSAAGGGPSIILGMEPRAQSVKSEFILEQLKLVAE